MTLGSVLRWLLRILNDWLQRVSLDPVRLLARAQTLTLLERLGSESKRAKRKKGELILFLYAAGLINKGEKIVVPLLDADLSGANLSGAHLSGVYLGSADLSGADLSGSHPFDAILEGANLSGSHLNGAELCHADLQHADLSGADLSRADLRIANLSDANLSDANLSKADLRKATVTKEQLSRCESLEGATMPDGKKYEDWLKDLAVVC